MDKKIDKMLKEILDDLFEDGSSKEKVTKEENEGFADRLKARVQKSLKEETFISIEIKGGGEGHISYRGSNVALLIALAILEEEIFSSTKTPDGLFEIIKGMVSKEEVK